MLHPITKIEDHIPNGKCDACVISFLQLNVNFAIMFLAEGLVARIYFTTGDAMVSFIFMVLVLGHHRWTWHFLCNHKLMACTLCNKTCSLIRVVSMKYVRLHKASILRYIVCGKKFANLLFLLLVLCILVLTDNIATCNCVNIYFVMSSLCQLQKAS